MPDLSLEKEKIHSINDIHPQEQLRFMDNSEISRMLSEKNHWMEIRAYHLKEMHKHDHEARIAQSKIENLTDSIESQRTYTSLDINKFNTPPQKLWERILDRVTGSIK